MMNPLNRQLFFKGLRKQLAASLSPEKATAVWEDAGKEYTRIQFRFSYVDLVYISC